VRRIPLWATLVPLMVGLAIYWWYWDRERAAFERRLDAVFGEGRASVGGFPYRLESDVAKPRLRHDGQYALDVEAERAVINRQPWRDSLSFIRLIEPRLQWRAAALDIDFEVASRTAKASLRLDGERIVRLSSVNDDAELRLPFVGTAATAKSFEWHLRETPAAPDPASRAPTFPEQAQLVLAADAIRFGKGDPLKLAAQIGLTSAAPIWDLAGWRRGGTAELRGVTLSDAAGEVATLIATGSASLTAPLRIAGTIETVCPISVQAAFAGIAAPVREYRTRRPVKLGFGGTVGDLELLLPAGGLRRMPVRAQEEPCPKLVA
jgi:hypothetical protein